MEDKRRSFRCALEAGVPIAMGTDCSGQDLLPHGLNALETELMVQAGMAPRDAIVAATSNAARVIGLADEVGSIEAGKWADLVTVRADPLEKIPVLQCVDVVIQRGTVVVDWTSGPRRS